MGLVYDPRGLTEVTTDRPGMPRVTFCNWKMNLICRLSCNMIYVYRYTLEPCPFSVSLLNQTKK
jgi:hypothetical protein